MSENDTNTAVETAENEQNGQVGDGQQQPAQPAQNAAPSGWSIVKTMVVRMVIIYFISSFFRRGNTPSPATKDGVAPMPSNNIFLKETYMDMYVYISEQEDFKDFLNPDALFWLEEEIVYGDWTGGFAGDGSYTHSGQYEVPESVQNNGTVYLHAYFVKAGVSPNPADEGYSRRYTVYKRKVLNKYKKRRYHTTKNLWTGTTDAHPDLIKQNNKSTVEVLSHWHPNLTVNMIDDHTPWTKGSIPSPLDEYIEFEPGTNNYYPVVYFNDYWNMNSDYMPINETTPVLNFTLTFAPLSLFKWQMYAAQGMKNKWYSYLGEDVAEESDEDQDSLKSTFLETSPYLLGLTVIVSIVHSVFEFLAFKNDIQFWRNRKSLEGLSVRSVFFNVFQSVIVLLYVMDNETNFVIRVSVFIGLAIECWKIQKVIDIKLDRENMWFGSIPRLTYSDKSTYTQSETKKYDMLAFKYLSWLLFPLLVCYAIYSVIYNEHRSWYSFVLSMMYGFLLTFGFIMMTPQLFINYKLKSVAHLPWRMLSYKALNTFIDDLFAFVIKMPTLYRLGCFRDDIIFLIFLYQRYIYRIDPKRVNEFGTSADMFDEDGNVIPMEEHEALEGTAAETEDTAAKPVEAENSNAEQKKQTGKNKKSKAKNQKEKKND